MSAPTSAPRIALQPLPYAGLLAEREVSDITLVVIHCTELPDLATAREYGERVLYDSGTGASGHWYIDRDGSIVEYVPATRVAHHVRGHNAHSVGIELVNRGRFPHWYDSRHQAMDQPYPAPQIGALGELLAHLRATLPALRGIAGHEDLDLERVAASDDPARTVARKRDPGPLFPWQDVLARVPLTRIGA
ncbi:MULTISPECIES: N-acetylmuramoyl-L-alanine amidase [Luteimonas]|uniref:N-acetylmuramoyl-L-alanine amidase n=1 Tax=Luteimonas chenhongjianii TaxID=2006110 RepID=A0A290XE07_9GAMM|nr:MULTISPECIES: N-acetylmuramoyl-L-alanine amidase [Luteimonas]ATD67313.1 N-acetylmuramoyl-L-alanine amidase [Luteimonas chenhongjianii]RPD86547.1 N-acetylmuramoyl-L-alanine amidase [Luteimonas sp. 100069]